jgi:glyoxylase-like metal-dependent hydrolase (beta-lactamase superfamily II)
LEALEEIDVGSARVLFGARRGKYPQGNSVLVRGREETALIDPSLGLLGRAPIGIDRVLLSHCHEDHVAGLHLFPDAPCHVHEADLPGLGSLEGLMAIYGYPAPITRAFESVVVEQFHYVPRPDALPFRDGDAFDLGGVRVRALHAPGHTRGHSFFWIEPDDVVFLADVDLSSFGPYYGDAWSCLEDFERTLRFARDLDARAYVTFHHVGVLDGRAAFLDRLDRFARVIADREARLLAFLAEPRDLDEIARHRFVYRPGDPVPFAEAVERRSMAQHLARLAGAGSVREVEPGRWLSAHGRTP